MSFVVSGMGATVTLETNVTLSVTNSGRIHVFVNDYEIQNILLNAQQQSYLVASSLPFASNNVTIAYTLEPLLSGANRDMGQTVSFVGISVGNGGVVAQPNPPLSRRIDIVGDSISAGSGYDKLESIGDPLSLGTACHPWAPTIGNSQNYNWETYAARSLRANATTIAWSGKGLIYNSGCHAGPTLPTLYNRTFATQSAGNEPWDFTRAFRPDAVLVYLGTNDFSCNRTEPAAFTDALVSFMVNISALYAASPGPAAKTTFFLAVGPMSPVLPYEPIVAAIDAALALGVHASLLDLRGNASMPLDGCGGHPGPFGHWTMARLAVAQIKAVMGW